MFTQVIPTALIKKWVALSSALVLIVLSAYTSWLVSRVQHAWGSLDEQSRAQAFPREQNGFDSSHLHACTSYLAYLCALLALGVSVQTVAFELRKVTLLFSMILANAVQTVLVWVNVYTYYGSQAQEELRAAVRHLLEVPTVKDTRLVTVIACKDAAIMDKMRSLHGDQYDLACNWYHTVIDLQRNLHTALIIVLISFTVCFVMQIVSLFQGAHRLNGDGTFKSSGDSSQLTEGGGNGGMHAADNGKERGARGDTQLDLDMSSIERPLDSTRGRKKVSLRIGSSKSRSQKSASRDIELQRVGITNGDSTARAVEMGLDLQPNPIALSEELDDEDGATRNHSSGKGAGGDNFRRDGGVAGGEQA